MKKTNQSKTEELETKSEESVTIGKIEQREAIEVLVNHQGQIEIHQSYNGDAARISLNTSDVAEITKLLLQAVAEAKKIKP